MEEFFSPKLGEDQKKKEGLRRQLKCFFLEINFPSKFGTIFGRNLQHLFMLAGSFASDHPALKSRLGCT